MLQLRASESPVFTSLGRIPWEWEAAGSGPGKCDSSSLPGVTSSPGRGAGSGSSGSAVRTFWGPFPGGPGAGRALVPVMITIVCVLTDNRGLSEAPPGGSTANNNPAPAPLIPLHVYTHKASDGAGAQQPCSG